MTHLNKPVFTANGIVVSEKSESPLVYSPRENIDIKEIAAVDDDDKSIDVDVVAPIGGPKVSESHDNKTNYYWITGTADGDIFSLTLAGKRWCLAIDNRFEASAKWKALKLGTKIKARISICSGSSNGYAMHEFYESIVASKECPLVINYSDHTGSLWSDNCSKPFTADEFCSLTALNLKNVKFQTIQSSDDEQHLDDVLVRFQPFAGQGKGCQHCDMLACKCLSVVECLCQIK